MTHSSKSEDLAAVEQGSSEGSAEVHWPVEGLEAPLLEHGKSEADVSGWSRVAAGSRALGRIATLPFRLLWSNGIVCMIVAQALLAAGAIMTKFFDAFELPLMEVLIIRGVLGFLLCFLGCKVANIDSLSVPRNLIRLVGLRASIAGFGAGCLFMAYRMLPVGDAMALSKLSAITTVALTWLLGWEAVNWKMFVGATITGLGGVAVVRPPFLFGESGWDTDRLIGVILALTSTLFFTMGGMFVGKIGTRLNTLVLAMWAQVGITPLPIFLLVISFPDPFLWPLNLLQVGVILAFTASVVLGRILEIRSLQLCNASVGTTLATSSIVFSYALGFVLLHERIGVLAVAGTVLIFVGVWVVTIGKNKGRCAVESDQ